MNEKTWHGVAFGEENCVVWDMWERNFIFTKYFCAF